MDAAGTVVRRPGVVCGCRSVCRGGAGGVSVRYLVAVFVCVCAVWGGIHAETPAGGYFHDDLDTLWSALPELTVTGESVTGGEASPVQRLSGRALEALSANSVADAMRYFSGVQLKDYGGVGGVKTIDVRSMGSNHIGVFYDGLPLGNAQNGQIDLGKYSLDNVEDITVYNGQKSRVLQPARDFASASAVYIRSRRPRLRDGRRFGMAARFRTGSFGLVNPSLRADFRLSDHITATVNSELVEATGRYRFRYRSMFSDGTLAWDTTAVRQNGDIHARRIEGSVYGSPDGGGEWQGKVYFYDSSKGIPGAIVNNVWHTAQRQWDRNFFVQGNWRTRLGGRAELLLNGKYAIDRMRYLNPDTTMMLTDNTFHQYELYLSAAGRYEITDSWDAGLAVDWQRNTLDSDMAAFAYPERNLALVALASSWEWRGLRVEGSGLLTVAVDHTHPRHTSGRRDSRTQVTPAVAAVYAVPGGTGLSVRGFYKRIFRLPTFNDLYYTDIGNADLKPEFATQLNLGVTWRRSWQGTAGGNIELTADAYHNRVTDKIIAVPKGTGQYRWMMMNIGRVRITGLDATATAVMNLPAGVTLNGRLTYTWQRALDYSDPQDCGDGGTWRGQIAYIPIHSGSATARVEWKGLHAGYSWIYVGERWHTSSNIPVNHEQPWYTSDLTAGWRQPLGRSALDLTVEINNLFDQQYEVISNYPMPGRNFKFILSWEI